MFWTGDMALTLSSFNGRQIKAALAARVHVTFALVSFFEYPLRTWGMRFPISSGMQCFAMLASPRWSPNRTMPRACGVVTVIRQLGQALQGTLGLVDLAVLRPPRQDLRQINLRDVVLDVHVQLLGRSGARAGQRSCITSGSTATKACTNGLSAG